MLVVERIEIDVSDWPRCLVCDMRVEEFYAEYRNETLILRAVCHNAKEKVEIKPEVWDNAFLESVRLEFAFRGTEQPTGPVYNYKQLTTGE